MILFLCNHFDLLYGQKKNEICVLIITLQAKQRGPEVFMFPIVLSLFMLGFAL